MEEKPQGERPDTAKQGRPRKNTSALWLMIVLLLVGMFLIFSQGSSKYSEIDYSFFIAQVEAGNVAKIQLQGQFQLCHPYGFS